MANLKWLMVNDLHFGVKNNHKLFHDIAERFCSEQLIPFIDREGVSKVFMLGDFFDQRKAINVETLEVARRAFLDPLREREVDVYMILGNHDVYYRNTNRVNSLNSLIRLDEYPNVNIFQVAQTISVDGEQVLMLPWINDENLESTIKILRETDARYVMSHLELAGFEFSRGVVAEHGQIDTDLLARFDAVWTGHYHHKSSRGNIHYLGTQYEMTWADYNDPKGFHLFDGEELRFIENPEKTFIRLEYDDSAPEKVEALVKQVKAMEGKYVKLVVKRKQKPVVLERFLDKLLAQNPFDVNVIDETASVNLISEENVNAPSSTIETVERFVYNDLSTELDKDRLFSMVKNLYIKAKESANDE